jgi:hypothetical protein
VEEAQSSSLYLGRCLPIHYLYLFNITGPGRNSETAHHRRPRVGQFCGEMTERSAASAPRKDFRRPIGLSAWLVRCRVGGVMIHARGRLAQSLCSVRANQSVGAKPAVKTQETPPCSLQWVRTTTQGTNHARRRCCGSHHSFVSIVGRFIIGTPCDDNDNHKYE